MAERGFAGAGQRAGPDRAARAAAPSAARNARADAIKALQQSIGNRAVRRLLDARAEHTPAPDLIQAKRTYIGYSGNHVDVIREKLRALEQREKLTPLSDTAFIYGLTGLTVSPLDYGVINLSDDQHLMLLYNYIAKQAKPLESGRTVETDEGTKPETETIEEQEAIAREEQAAWKTAKKEQETAKGAEGSVFQQAFLGAGASIAYYLATLSVNYDPSEAIIIGPDQPWSGQRGPGVVAHPEHMITPMLQFVGVTEIDDTWLERGKFSTLITKVLTQSGLRRLRSAVTAVKKEGKFYEITVAGESKPIFAREVVSGVGVGAHAPPKGVSQATTPEEIPQKRIMDMDLFTNVADRLAKSGKGVTVAKDGKGDKSAITVILSGGNGGIDVAFDALNKGYKVHWIVGQGGPKFLPGFFNYAAYLPYLRTLKDSKQAGKAKIDDPDKEIKKAESELAGLYDNQEDMFEGVLERFMPETTKFEGVYFGYLDSSAADDSGVTANVKHYDAIRGDLLVYAQGQDNATFNLFAGFMKDLVPDTDVSKRFTDEGETTLGLKSTDNTLKIVGATAFRLAPQIAASAGQIEVLYKQLSTAREAIANVTPGNLSYMPFSDVWNRYLEFKTAVREQGNVGGALTALGAASKDYDAYRGKLAVDALTPEETRAFQAFDVAQSRARNRAQGLMQPVIASLPDNVLINDQLTPTRSQIVATTGFVPYDIGQRANFVTDDRTALAVHISARYPKFADTGGTDVEALIQKIVDSRTKPVPDGPDYQPVPPHGAKFQKFWEDRLATLNA